MAVEGIIELIRQDHDHFRGEFDRIATAPAEQRGDLFRQLVGELARHEAAEEALIHPTVRDEDDDGRVVADAVLQEESAAESMLARMEDMEWPSHDVETWPRAGIGSRKRARPARTHTRPRLPRSVPPSAPSSACSIGPGTPCGMSCPDDLHMPTEATS